MNDHGIDLKHLCGKFLDQYFDPGDFLPALTQLIVGRLPKATADEIEDALHSLWRLTRHLTRETCWSQVMWELHQEGKLSGEFAVREEIAGWYFGDTTDSGAAQQEEGKLERRRQPERRKHPTEPPPVPATIDEYVRSYYPEGDPVSLALPKVESYDDVDGVERYWYLYRDLESEWSLDQFHMLGALARAFAVRVGDSDEFWAVFGPIQDALCGFREF